MRRSGSIGLHDTVQIEKADNFTDEEKSDYLKEVISKIVVHQTPDKNGHTLQIYFRQPIVKDDLKYMDENNKKKGYKVINGKKVSRVRVSRNKGGRPKRIQSKKTHMLNLFDSDTLGEVPGLIDIGPFV